MGRGWGSEAGVGLRTSDVRRRNLKSLNLALGVVCGGTELLIVLDFPNPAVIGSRHSASGLAELYLLLAFLRQSQPYISTVEQSGFGSPAQVENHERDKRKRSIAVR